MSKLFDALTRSLLEKYPADWLNQLGLIHGEPVRVMNSDLSSVTAEADKVIRVEGPQPWLVHIELQAGYDRTLPRRLLRYNALLNVKHDLPVHTVAILLHPGADGPELTGVLRQQSPDGHCRLEFCYHLVRAWQWDTEAILAGGMGLLPLAPLSARELDQIPIIVERLKERVDPAAVTAEISELWTSAAIMAGLRFPWELIKPVLEESRPCANRRPSRHLSKKDGGKAWKRGKPERRGGSSYASAESVSVPSMKRSRPSSTRLSTSNGSKH